jgi:hypothetical protein
MAIALVVSTILLSFMFLLIDLTRRRLERSDPESARFREAIATLPRIKKNPQKIV